MRWLMAKDKEPLVYEKHECPVLEQLLAVMSKAHDL